ncbi:MAG: hypothetical protein ACM3PE_07570 [Deltaproteobacteria bacterium]
MKPSVLIILDKPRNIRLNTNALVKVEEVLERSLSEFGTSFGITEIRAMLWAGLLHEDKSLSLDTVGDLIDEAGFEYVAEKVGEAINIAMGIKPEESDPK